MELEQARKRAEELRVIIEKNNRLYYDQDAPELEDFEYDALNRELKQLEAEYPELVTAASPTQHVGGTASSKFTKVTHAVKMESLQDAFSFDELREFDARVRDAGVKSEYVVEAKIDGLSVSLEYRMGQLVRGSTRGDGVVGEDVTENILTIRDIPHELPDAPDFLEVRGEVYMPHSAFFKLKEQQELEDKTPFKNPRNAAAGSPGSGKTTLLRSIVQRLCESDSLVSVIDERGELMACETGSLPRAAQIRCDVYARCTKPEGIAMALRCMNPQILVCDELGTAEDAQAVAQGVASGVVFFATAIPRRVYIKSPRWPHCWPQAPLQKPPFCPGVPSPALCHSGSHCDSVAACCGRYASALCRHGLWLYGGSTYPGLPAAAAQPVPAVRLSGRAAQRTGTCRPGAFAPRSAPPGICRLLPGGCCSSGRSAASVLPARGPAV